MPAAMLASVFCSASAIARPMAPRIAMIEVLGTPRKLERGHDREDDDAVAGGLREQRRKILVDAIGAGQEVLDRAVGEAGEDPAGDEDRDGAEDGNRVGGEPGGGHEDRSDACIRAFCGAETEGPRHDSYKEWSSCAPP